VWAGRPVLSSVVKAIQGVDVAVVTQRRIPCSPVDSDLVEAFLLSAWGNMKGGYFMSKSISGGYLDLGKEVTQERRVDTQCEYQHQLRSARNPDHLDS